MKVYVVTEEWDYEGSKTLAVYSTQEEAEKVVDGLYKSKRSVWYGRHFDWKEFTLDASSL